MQNGILTSKFTDIVSVNDNSTFILNWFSMSKFIFYASHITKN